MPLGERSVVSTKYLPTIYLVSCISLHPLAFVHYPLGTTFGICKNISQTAWGAMSA